MRRIAFIIAVVCLCGVAVAAPGGECQQDWVQPLGRVVGRLHPLLVHFPIALLIVGAGLELLGAARRQSKPSPTGVVCLAMGWLGACAAAGAGWLNAAFEHAGDDSWILFSHRWIGIGTASLAAVVLIAAMVAKKYGGRATGVYRAGLLLTAGFVSVGAHLGGMMAYGESYLADSLAAVYGTSRPSNKDAKAEARPRVATVQFPGNGIIDFDTHVRPIFEASCIECHGKQLQEGGLQLDNKNDAFEGGDSGPAIIVGDATNSLLLRRVLGLDNYQQMPKRRDPLPEEQIRILEAWIEQGAKWPQEK